MVVMSDWRLQLVPVGAEKPGLRGDSAGNRPSEVFAPRAASQRTALGCRRVPALRTWCLGWPVDDSVPPGEPGQLSGLATGCIAEVVDKQLRGGRGMRSANFSSHLIHDIETAFQLRIWHRI
jgi:hypothetical protein